MTHIEGRFEWDTVKAEKNFAKHGISFSDAMHVLEGETYEMPATTVAGEIRSMTLGELDGIVILAVVSTERPPRIRIISARPASRDERKTYHEGRNSR